MHTLSPISQQDKSALMVDFLNSMKADIDLSKKLLDLDMKNPLIQRMDLLIMNPIAFFAKEKNFHSAQYRSLVSSFVSYWLKKNNAPKCQFYFDDSKKADSMMIYFILSEDTFQNRDLVIDQICHLESNILEDNIEINCLFIDSKVGEKLEVAGLEPFELT